MREAWERHYSRRRRPWAGAVVLPTLGPGLRVLELGCGGGRLLLPLARGPAPPELFGLDIARPAILDLARDLPGVLVRADAARLPFRGGAFDSVVCRHVLGHLASEERRAAAGEVLRVLTPGGRAFFEGFSTDDGRFGKGRMVEEGSFVRGDGILHHYFQAGEVAPLFAGSGRVTVRERSWTVRAGRTRMTRSVIEAEIVR